LETVSLVWPVAPLVIEIATLATAAPLGSSTDPVIVALSCAQATVVSARRKAIKAIRTAEALHTDVPSGEAFGRRRTWVVSRFIVFSVFLA
jgi:hypothetical protein